MALTDTIDEAAIERLVREFYARVRADGEIGPIFAARIEDWEAHIALLRDFWSSILLASGRYHGQPMRHHVNLPVEGRHFDRWLETFEATARGIFDAATADRILERARRIAASFELGAAGAQGLILAPGQRLRRPDLDAANG